MKADALEQLRRDVQYVKDRLDILDCVNRQSRGHDRHDVELMTSVYHADGVLCPVTLLMHLAAAVEPRPGAKMARACVVVAGGADPMLVSHGDDSGPKKLRFSAEDGYQRTHGHGTAICLSAF